MNRLTKAFTFIFLTLFLCIINVNADTTCTNKELANLNKTAGLIKTNYEIVTNTATIEAQPELNIPAINYDVYSFKITIYNITNDIYILGTNDNNSDQINITYDQTLNGKYTFTSNDQDNIIKYTFVVYSNLNNCKGKLLRDFYFIKPKYNAYESIAICKEYPTISYCEKFITKDIKISEEELSEKINKLMNQSDNTKVSDDSSSFTKILKKYYLYIIGGVVTILGIIVTIIIIRKKRSKL